MMYAFSEDNNTRLAGWAEYCHFAVKMIYLEDISPREFFIKNIADKYRSEVPEDDESAIRALYRFKRGGEWHF